jgi:hypothetical protein
LKVADDTTGLAWKDIRAEPTNAELTKNSRWFRANKMGANMSNTKYIILHMRSKPDNIIIKLFYDDKEPNENHIELVYEHE